MGDDTLLDERVNFCRVFELPKRYNAGFVHGGRDTTFREVDWFNPIPPRLAGTEPMTELEIADMLVEHVKIKRYIREGYTYLIVTDYGASILIDHNGDRATNFLR